MAVAVGVIGLAFAGVCFLLGTRALQAFADDRAAERVLKREKYALKERLGAKPEAKDSEAIPEDLVQRIQSWEDDFAKADEERNIRVLFAQLGDWDKVRRNLTSYGHAPQVT